MSELKLNEKDILKLLRWARSRYPISPTMTSMVNYFGVSKSLIHKKLNNLIAEGKVYKDRNNYYIK